MPEPIADGRPIRWGILGAGGIADTVSGDINLTEGNVVTAVGARHADRAARFAAKHGATRSYGDYHSLVNDDEVDVVYVTTTHPHHRAHALMAIKAGKAVLIEKPVCLNARDAREVFAAAIQADVFSMEAMWTRTNPLIRKAQQLIADGAIGEVRGVRNEFGLGRAFDPMDRLYELANGGGALLDLGVYPATFAYLFLGPPDTVHTVGTLSPTGSDETVAMQWMYGDHPGAQLWTSALIHAPNEAAILGTKGWMSFLPEAYRPTGLILHNEAGEDHTPDPLAGQRSWLPTRDRRGRALPASGSPGKPIDPARRHHRDPRNSRWRAGRGRRRLSGRAMTVESATPPPVHGDSGPMRPVRFGMVGYGFGGRYFHTPLIVAAPECDLIGVMTSSPERQALVAREVPGARTYGSLAELVDAGVEAVAISTPADTHSSVTEEALNLGLAVVCDKPFALNPDAARHTVALADERQLVLEPISEPPLGFGFPHRSQARCGGRTRHAHTAEVPVRTLGSGAGTRPLRRWHPAQELGSHLMDQALILLGRAASVYAEWRIRESGLEDDVFVAVTDASSTPAQLWGSWSRSAPGPRYRVTGTAATFVLGPADTQELLLLAGQTPATLGERWGVEPPESHGTLHTGTASTGYATERGRWDLFYPTFAESRPGPERPACRCPRRRRHRDSARGGAGQRVHGCRGARTPAVNDLDSQQLAALLADEQRLVFSIFDLDTSWQLGSLLRAEALRAALPIAMSIRRNGQCLFHAALPGSSADNDGWLLRKSAVVERYGHSSYFVGCKFRAEGRDFDVDSRLDIAKFAAHGGAFPIILGASGCIGTVAVSGLPQLEDHRFVVTHLERFLVDSGQIPAR